MGEKLTAAQKSATEDLDKARFDAKTLIEEARTEGLKKGATQAEQLKQKLTKLKELYASEIDQDLLRNALEASQELVKTELESSPPTFVQFTP